MMKRVKDLTVEDLRRSSVWQYSSLGEEEFVQEIGNQVLSEDDSNVYIAATEFILGDGSKFLGFCSPQDDSGLDYVQPVIVTERGHVKLWFDDEPAVSDLTDQWNRLDRSEVTIFPIRFKCLVQVDGNTISGEVESLREMGAA